MLKMKNDYNCEEIATVLCQLSSEADNIDIEIIKDLIDALYQLKSIASNEYNSNYYRTFWNMLQNITNYNIKY